MDSHSSDAFRLFSAARARTQRAQQSSKIKELAEAVKSAGFLTLDEQAKALGLSRSTAWTILKASHKASGLSGSIINRMLAAPELPPFARTKIFEYVEEKAAGLYGGSRSQRRKFAARLSIEKLPVCPETESSLVPEHNGITVRAARGRGSSQKGPFGSRS
jgi:predicted DNA-binding transcriptional regulator AlpA